MITKILRCVDNFAPSDKYPNYGFAADFYDEDNISYFAEYPNAWSSPIVFEQGKKYEITFNLKTYKVLGFTQNKISRLKNIREI